MTGSGAAQLGLELDEHTASAAPPAAPMRCVRVRPDVIGIDREFDYLVDPDAEVHVGDLVRIGLGGRREAGWITALDVAVEPGIEPVPVRAISGRGPAPDLIGLADWAAWRWAGRPPHLLRTASPPARVRSLPPATPPVGGGLGSRGRERFGDVLAAPLALLELGPAEDRIALAEAAVATERGHALILCPTVREARALTSHLRRVGVPVALLAGTGTPTEISREWARARAGCTVVGTRAAAWAPMADLARVVVFDEHDESYQGQQTPTWHARDVVIERARRSGAPCLLISPVPSPEARGLVAVTAMPTSRRRTAWPRLEIIDRRQLDPSTGPLFSEPVVDVVRSEGRILCILNRTGRVRLLVCARCETIAACEACGGAVALEQNGGVEEFVCSRDDHRRPPVCLTCHATRFKHLRLGVSRAREDLEALAREPVGEVTASSSALPDTRVLIGTEALLRRVTRADAVVFLDVDQHLLAPRHRAGQDALGLLALAARAVSRRPGGRLIVQTHEPDHPVLDAVRRRDPGLFTEADMELHRALGLPPFTAMALVSGAGAPAFVDGLGALDPAPSTDSPAAWSDSASDVSSRPLPGSPGRPVRPMIQGPVDDVWRVRAPDHRRLCDALAAVERPADRLRIEVDPRDA